MRCACQTRDGRAPFVEHVEQRHRTAENQELGEDCAARWIDELGQESQEEECDLGIEDARGDCLTQCRTGRAARTY
jgi:hypothetical protein